MQYILNGFISFALLCPVSLGFWLIYRTCRFFYFAFGAFIALGAYLYSLFLQSSSPPIVAAIFSLMLCLVIGIILELFIFRTLSKYKHTGLIKLVASIGIYVVLTNLLSLLFGDHPLSVRSKRLPQVLTWAGATITLNQILIIISALLCVLIVYAIHRFTRIGKIFEAVASNPTLANVVGINANRVYLGAMGLGSALAVFGGILNASDSDITPRMGMEPMMSGIVAMIIGGSTFWGTICGAFSLGIVKHLSVIWLPTQWQDVILFVILLSFLIIRPEGFLGKKIRKATV